VLGANTQTRDQGSIWDNNRLGYPSYSIDDSQVLFSTINDSKNIIAITEMEANKLSGVGEAFILIEDAEWATWFATGNRDLNTSNEELEKELGITIYPNPVSNTLTIEWLSTDLRDAAYQLYDLRGQLILSESIVNHVSEINTSNLVSGAYFLRVFPLLLLHLSGDIRPLRQSSYQR